MKVNRHEYNAGFQPFLPMQETYKLHPTVDVLSLLSQIRPLMDIAFEIASKPKNTLAEKIDALQIMTEKQMKIATRKPTSQQKQRSSI